MDSRADPQTIVSGCGPGCLGLPHLATRGASLGTPLYRPTFHGANRLFDSPESAGPISDATALFSDRPFP